MTALLTALKIFPKKKMPHRLKWIVVVSGIKKKKKKSIARVCMVFAMTRIFFLFSVWFADKREDS